MSLNEALYLTSLLEATDVLESFAVNRQRLKTVWDSAITIAIQSSPGQQLGIGLGVGW